MTSATATRRAGATALLAIVALFAAACGPTQNNGQAGGPTEAGNGTLGTGNPTPPVVITDPPAYPATAQAYAEAVLEAWPGDDDVWFAALTTPMVYEQLVELPASIDDNWDFHMCDGAAGSSYCSFINDDGDVLILRISHALLSQPHAAIQVTLDETTYPEDGVLYVKEFVKAWQFGNQVRMLLLGTPEVVVKVGNAPTVTPNYPAPTCCGGGLLQVKAQWAGVFATFDVGTTLLGGPHAIVDFDKELGIGG